MNMQINLPLDEQFLKDVLVTICETPGVYGIGSWAHVLKVTKGESADYTQVKIAYDVEDGDEGNRKGRFTMGLPQVAEGIRRIMTIDRDTMHLHPSNVGRVAGAVASKDAGEIDGEAADWIAQAAIFGKQVYG